MPSLEALAAIAAAIDVPAAWLLLDSTVGPAGRPGRGPSEGGGPGRRRDDRGRRRDLARRVHPRGLRAAGPRDRRPRPPRRRAPPVLAGRWRMTQGDHVVELGPGDYLAWDPAVPHDVENIGDEPGRILDHLPAPRPPRRRGRPSPRLMSRRRARRPGHRGDRGPRPGRRPAVRRRRRPPRAGRDGRVAPRRRRVEAEIPAERWLPVVGDLRERATARAVADAADGRFGRIDVLVHLVGGWSGGTAVVDLDPEELRTMLDQHLWTTLHLVQAVVPGMVSRGFGRVLAVGTPFAAAPAGRGAAYAIAKSAEELLLRSLAREVAATGVTANLVVVRKIDVEHERETEPRDRGTRRGRRPRRSRRRSPSSPRRRPPPSREPGSRSTAAAEPIPRRRRRRASAPAEAAEQGARRRRAAQPAGQARREVLVLLRPVVALGRHAHSTCS